MEFPDFWDFPAFLTIAGEYLCIPDFSKLGILFGKRSTEKQMEGFMQTKGCYGEIREDCLVIRQPYKNEHYEVCHFFYREMEKIVEGSRRGIPEFYIVIVK